MGCRLVFMIMSNLKNFQMKVYCKLVYFIVFFNNIEKFLKFFKLEFSKYNTYMYE